MDPRNASARALPAGSESSDPEAIDFVRFCYRRRRVGWPELYDEMCAVAARREFNGWDHEQLAERGLTFSLYEMPRLAAWVRTVIGPQPSAPGTDHRPIPQAAAGTA